MSIHFVESLTEHALTQDIVDTAENKAALAFMNCILWWKKEANKN